jgi:tRNA pseudouridine38-40 synthase
VLADRVRTFRLVVQYDGGAFHGWQRQPAWRTVQGTLEVALTEVLGDEQVRITGAGRTDAGVHARGQVASFSSPTELPATALVPLVNRRLPDDVRVRSAAVAVPGFDARRSAVARHYAYHLIDREDVLLGRMAWYPRRTVKAESLDRAVGALLGEHDCSAFRSAGSGPANPNCHLVTARAARWERGVRVELAADHFLYRMVRNIVGTALSAADHGDPAEAMRAVLESRERARAGVTAPPQGLVLEQVDYPEEGA